MAQGLPVVRHAQSPEAVSACDLVVGVSGWRKNGAAAVVLDGRLAAFCEHERLTRVRRDRSKRRIAFSNGVRVARSQKRETR